MPNWAFWRRPKPLSREQSLASVPLRNEAIEVERTERLDVRPDNFYVAGDGSTVKGDNVRQPGVRLIIPLRATWWTKLLSRVFYVPKQRRVALDEIGSYVWDLCDGRNSVRDIIRALAARYKLHRKEAEVSVVAYLRQLARRRLVGIAVLPPHGKAGKQDR